eukprot:358466-Chlamydomonas_euryale.AAC.2
MRPHTHSRTHAHTHTLSHSYLSCHLALSPHVDLGVFKSAFGRYLTDMAASGFTAFNLTKPFSTVMDGRVKVWACGSAAVLGLQP